MKNYPTFVAENKTNITDLDISVTTHEVEIQQEKKSTFDKIIKKISRLAKFMKLPAPVVVGKGKKMYYTLGLKSNEKISKNITNFITDKWDEIKKAKVDFDKEQLEKRKSSAHIAIILSAEVDIFDITLADIIKPKDEWTLLGVIDHKEGLIKAAPSQQVPYELIPKDLFNGCQCDHCNKPTRRNKSVFIQNNDTHKIMRVGGTCIKYYLGIDYEKVLDYVSELSLFVNEYYGNGDANFGDFDWDGGGRGGRMEIFVDVKDTAKYFLAIAKKHGYMSKSGAEKINATKTGDEKMVQTTKDKVENVLDFVFKPFDSREYGKNTSYMRDLYEKQLAEVTETIEKESDDSYNEFVKFVDDNYKENNFLVNVKNMVDAGSYKVNHMGYVLSACSMYYGKKYYEELKKKSEEERNAKNSVEKAESNWVGVVGEKSNFENLTIVHISGYQGQWGWNDVYKLKDEKGNIYTKFGVISPSFIVNDKTDVEVGATVSFTAEVKEHSDYKGVKQTVLGRMSKLN